ncbi:MAG: hypothetical protein RSB90_10745, partial [Eubacterium sp.]
HHQMLCTDHREHKVLIITPALCKSHNQVPSKGQPRLICAHKRHRHHQMLCTDHREHKVLIITPALCKNHNQVSVLSKGQPQLICAHKRHRHHRMLCTDHLEPLSINRSQE